MKYNEICFHPTVLKYIKCKNWIFSFFSCAFTYADWDRLSYSNECELEDFYFLFGTMFLWNNLFVSFVIPRCNWQSCIAKVKVWTLGFANLHILHLLFSYIILIHLRLALNCNLIFNSLYMMFSQSIGTICKGSMKLYNLIHSYFSKYLNCLSYKSIQIYIKHRYKIHIASNKCEKCLVYN